MELTTHWRAAQTRGNRVHRRNTGGRRLRAAAATGAVVVAAMPSSRRTPCPAVVGATRSSRNPT